METERAAKPSSEDLWKRYEFAQASYKYHLDLVFRVFTYFGTSTIAIAVFYANTGNIVGRAGLASMGLFGLMLAILHLSQLPAVGLLNHEIDDLAFSLGLKIVLSVRLIQAVVLLFAGLYACAAVGLVWLAIYPWS